MNSMQSLPDRKDFLTPITGVIILLLWFAGLLYYGWALVGPAVVFALSIAISLLHIGWCFYQSRRPGSAFKIRIWHFLLHTFLIATAIFFGTYRYATSSHVVATEIELAIDPPRSGVPIFVRDDVSGTEMFAETTDAGICTFVLEAECTTEFTMFHSYTHFDYQDWRLVRIGEVDSALRLNEMLQKGVCIISDRDRKFVVGCHRRIR